MWYSGAFPDDWRSADQRARSRRAPDFDPPRGFADFVVPQFGRIVRLGQRQIEKRHPPLCCRQKPNLGTPNRECRPVHRHLRTAVLISAQFNMNRK